MKLENEDVERAWLNGLSNVSALNPGEGLRMLEASRLRSGDFSSTACADVFTVSEAMLRRGEQLELLGVESALAFSKPVAKAGGRKFLADVLLAPVAFGGSSLEHARIIGDLSLRRRAISLMRSAALRMSLPESTPTHLLEDLSGSWGQLLNQSPGMVNGEGALLALIDQLELAQSGAHQLVVSSGINELDAEIGGLQPGVLTLIGALPGVGKSSLLAAMARNIARRHTVGFFSLEDKKEWLAKRFLALEAGVPLFVLATRPMTPGQMDRVHEAVDRVRATLGRMIIDDREALTPADVAATAKDMILNFDAKVIFVDHLGELRFSRSERHDLDTAEALSVLRDVAKRHHVPMVVASHVKRRQGLTVNDEPSLTDFANSSAPERMARVALGLSKANGKLRVSILKQTNGKSGHSVDLQMHEQAGLVVSANRSGVGNEQQ